MELQKIDLKELQSLDEIKIDEIKIALSEQIKETQKITKIVDPFDKKEIEYVSSKRYGYAQTQSTFKRLFKLKRDEYNALAKKNLEDERDLTNDLEKEKIRLQTIVDEAKHAQEMTLRKEKLPQRKEKLKEIELELTDDELLSMKDQEILMFSLLQLKK